MAEQADAPEREDEVEDLEIEAQAPEGQDTETETDDPELLEGDEPEDEIEITFGDEAAPASKGENSELARHLRAEIRKRDEEIAALKRSEVAQPQAIEVGEKPTLESCDYDESKFEAELDAYKERKAKAEEVKAEAQQKVQAEQERFGKRLEAFAAGKTALKARDFEAAETAVVAGLSQVQQAIVIKAADDSAKLIYALGRHPQKLSNLAAIADPIEFTAALVKLEGTLKVTQRGRTPPDPDVPLRGAAPFKPAQDPKLERLEREAARTGDRTKVVQYKREVRTRAEGKK